MARYPGYDIFNINSDEKIKELRDALNNSLVIEGEIISANNGGFIVDYKGFPCFLPISISSHKCEQEIDISTFLNSVQKFKIKDIRNKSVILSRKAYLSDIYDKLEAEELSMINSGDSYTAKVRRIESYGVYLFKEYTVGLLHVNKIFDIDFDTLDNECKASLKIILKEVFHKGDMINVIVDKVADNKYSLLFDKTKDDVIKYLALIKEILNSDPAHSSLKAVIDK